MEKTQEEILDEILAELTAIREAMNSVESKLARLNLMEDKPIELDDDFAFDEPSEEAPVVEAPVEEAPVVEAPVVEAPLEKDLLEDDLPEDDLPEDDLPEEEVDIFGIPVERKMDINEVHRATRKKSVGESMEMNEAWRTAIPGSPVRDVRSAISLNDRILFIRELFHSDAELFQSTIERINSMVELDDVVSMLSEGFAQWDMNSDTVYRFMMAVRRKLRVE